MTGGPGPASIEEFLDAARAVDSARLHALIDWPTSGVGRFTRSLAALPTERRAELAERGLREMLGHGQPASQDQPLGILPLGLAENPRAERRDDDLEWFLATVCPVPAAPGTPETVVRFVAEQQERIDAITTVHRVTYGRDGALWLGVLADVARFTLVRDLAD